MWSSIHGDCSSMYGWIIQFKNVGLYMQRFHCMVEVYACTYNIDYIYSSIDPANIVGIQDHAIVASSRSTA